MASRRIGSLAVFIVALSCVATTALGVDFDNGAGDFKWSSDANWNPDGVPGGDVFITGTWTGDTAIVLDSSVPTINQLGHGLEWRRRDTDA